MTSPPKSNLWALSLSALGVVYGDIGTSPLYALRECFSGAHSIPPTPENVLGVLSLIFWSLILVISVKYMAFVLRADNRGEGGILALTALACPRYLRDRHPILIGIGLFGAALLYGDGIITPAISVLSAVEGLGVATPFFDPYVLPIASLILFFLFWLQKYGTAKIGVVCGPIILIWFLVLGALGIGSLWSNPSVLAAIDPTYAFEFFRANGKQGFLTLGAVFLVMTGGEALYADMGHFGRKPIRRAWFAVALPGLLLNYFGQAALIISNPEAAAHPFYYLAPSWALYPLVILAMFATLIASQAVISGVFSMTRQAMQLGYCPRMRVVHTSPSEIGQIYIPQVNWALLIATLWLVLEFRSSSALAVAYGMSVSTTMVITTLLMFVVSYNRWRWSLVAAVAVAAVLLVIDLAFLGANLVKIEHGGWFPLAAGLLVYTLMSTWRRGRQILAERIRAKGVQLAEFAKNISSRTIVRVPGIAIFMASDSTTTPPAIIHNLEHNKVLHERVAVLTVHTLEIPHVPASERIELEALADDFYRIGASYGFMDTPDIMEILDCCRQMGLNFPFAEITFFLGRETLLTTSAPGMAPWREHLFSFMSRNAQRATAFYNIPANRVIEVGMQVEL